MEVVALGEVGAAAWDDFCDSCSDAWFWHTTPWMTYLQAYKPELQTRPWALVAREGERILGVVPAMVERRAMAGEDLDIAAAGGPCWGPALADDLDDDHRAEVFLLLLGQINALASDRGVSKAWMRLTPLSPTFERRIVPLVTRERIFAPADGAQELHRRANLLASSIP